MILAPEELRSLVELKHRSPHELLGMHPLGDGTGVVVRALVPDAAQIEIVPTHEKNQPKIKLDVCTRWALRGDYHKGRPRLCL